MKISCKQLLSAFLDPKSPSFFQGARHGIEKECLRVTSEGKLAMTPHPHFLGSALTHPFVSTDFSESQLELITPTFKSVQGTKNFLLKLEKYLYSHLQGEFLWPSSAPCQLPQDAKIPLANYGVSDWGVEKHIYRKGLCTRYGPKMQMLSGVHYNFSFPEQFWDFLHKQFAKEEDKQLFISNAYLRLVRNFIRLGWINSYLFGATPVVDKSYIHESSSPLQKLNSQTYYDPFATSIRMSHLGYYSRVQRHLPITFNDFSNYYRDLSEAVSTRYPPFTKKGIYAGNQQIQLNDHILQVEAEHYARIRPKPKLLGHERPLIALDRGGVSYVEMRALDINPFVPEGVELSQLRFLHLFLVYCLFKDSPPISLKEEKVIADNQNRVALFGRKPLLRLFRDGKKIRMDKWADEILSEMEAFIPFLGNSLYEKSLEEQRLKVKEPELTPSAKLLRELRKHKASFSEYTLELAKAYQKKLKKHPPSSSFEKQMERERSTSLKKQEAEEIHDDFILREYEGLEISTQSIIREAKKRRITVDVIDEKDNFIRLTKGNRVEYVKQATKTRLDSLVSYLLMENKYVTKSVLEEKGIPVPKGNLYVKVDHALADYPLFENQKIVVKPNFTNYGLGIFFIEPHDKGAYRAALKKAFSYGEEVIVEEFCEGEEFRFLVIKGKVVAICQRLAANVVGDGTQTIEQLVKQKNQEPQNYKYYPIRLGKNEVNFLKDQSLTKKSVPKKGCRVFLRENSNVSTGGDSIDKTDAVHLGYHEVAINAASAADATFCGVDLMIKNCKRAPKERNHHVLELNFNPALLIHRYPIEGKKRYVEKDVLDALGF